jgi:hypothetical protein
MNDANHPTVADLSRQNIWFSQHRIMLDHIEQATYVLAVVSRLQWRIPWKGGRIASAWPE